MRFLPHLLLCATIISLLSPSSAFGWSKPHIVITHAALKVLPAWQKDLLREESTKLGDSYCLIPDHVFNDKENAKFAQMDSQPGELYILNLHLPAQQAENLETLHYFMVKAVQSLHDGKISDAVCYMGTICHQLEDYGSFKVRVGLHPELGEKGQAEFTVSGKDKHWPHSLSTAPNPLASWNVT